MNRLIKLFTGIADIFLNMKLRTKFILSLFTLVFFFYVIFGTITYQASEKTIRDNVSSLALKNVTKISTRIDYYLNDIQSAFNIMFTNQELSEYFESLKNIPVNKLNYSEYENFAFSNSSYKIISDIFELTGDKLSGVYLYDQKNVYFIHPHYTYFLGINSETNEDWYKKTLNGPNNVHIFVKQMDKPDLSGNPQYTISFTKLLKNKKNNDLIGILKIDLDYFRFREIIEEEYGSSYSNSVLNIFDNAKKKIYSSENSLGEAGIYPSQNSSQSGIEIKSVNNRQMYISYYTSPYTSWKFVSIIPADEVLKDLYKIKNTVIILTILCLFLILLFSSLISSALLKPVYQLASAMEKVEKGDFSTRVNTKRRDETGYLAESFNKMTSNIEKLINQVYNAELKQKEAELKALQSQINPHFLYNTLESIRGVALTNKIYSIASMAKSLSQLFRYSINGRIIVTIEEELLYLKNYISIQNFRHEDKFRLILDIPEEINNCTIPKLILQPLVENSIKHGLEMKLGNGNISIKAEVNNGVIKILVSDNGKGMSPEKLILLNKFLCEGKAVETTDDKSIKGPSSGIGVSNVNLRLKQLFGYQYGLKFLESLEGAVVEVTMPAKN